MSEATDVKLPEEKVDGNTDQSSSKDETRKEIDGGSEQNPPAKRKRRSRWDSGNSTTPTTSSSSSTSTPASSEAPAVVVDTTVAQQLAAQQVLQMQQQQLVQPQAALLGTTPVAPAPDCRVYVGSLNYDLKEADIKALFASFGTIRSFTMSYDNITGKSKGYCFVEYETKEMADAAMAMNQFQLAGRPIKVGRPLNAAPGSAAPSVPVNPAASLLNIPIPTAPSPASTSAQAFINGLGAGVSNPPL